MSQVVAVSQVAKSFGEVQAVTDVSFEVSQGEIFGLLGPNGAGKTTTIRLMLDIFKPDRGAVAILDDAPMTEAKKDRIGYMPEERGLYQDVALERFDLAAHKTKKVKELSKGMQQKAQIINTILHRPELIIIDEPFTSLDPINTQMVKDLMRELRDNGATIIMCTHQMHQVEELCDRILLIDDGCDLLYGNLAEIRRRYSGHAVLVKVPGELPELPGVEQVAPHNSALRLNLAAETTPQEVLQALMSKGALVERFEIAVPTLDEIFIRVVEEGVL